MFRPHRHGNAARKALENTDPRSVRDALAHECLDSAWSGPHEADAYSGDVVSVLVPRRHDQADTGAEFDSDAFACLPERQLPRRVSLRGAAQCHQVAGSQPHGEATVRVADRAWPLLFFPNPFVVQHVGALPGIAHDLQPRPRDRCPALLAHDDAMQVAVAIDLCRVDRPRGELRLSDARPPRPCRRPLPRRGTPALLGAPPPCQRPDTEEHCNRENENARQLGFAHSNSSRYARRNTDSACLCERQEPQGPNAAVAVVVPVELLTHSLDGTSHPTPHGFDCNTLTSGDLARR